MSMINYASREINCKIVYYGPGLGGKTTNLEHVYGRVQPNTRGKLISLATETERTLFFDFLPVDLGTIRGFKTRFHLYTVPGQVYYNASRKLILKSVDGIVFVADSQVERMEANQEAMQNLYENMQEYGYDLSTMPFVIQYNKRDLPNAAPLGRAAGGAQSGLRSVRDAEAAHCSRSVPCGRESHRSDSHWRVGGAGAILRGGRGHGRRRIRYAQGGEQARSEDARLTARAGAR